MSKLPEEFRESLAPGICLYCGNEFTSRSSRQKFCSSACCGRNNMDKAKMGLSDMSFVGHNRGWCRKCGKFHGSHKGIKRSDETRLLLSLSHLGIKQSEETKLKRNKSLNEYRATPEGQKKLQKWIESGNTPDARKKNGESRSKFLTTPKGKVALQKAAEAQGKPEVRAKHRLPWLGERNPMWKGGISFEQYDPNFNGELKEEIRARDNHTCQLCEITELECIKKYGRKLDVHHIDYNKKNSSESNLITLCIGCNLKVNHNREKYQKYFTKLMGEKELS